MKRYLFSIPFFLFLVFPHFAYAVSNNGLVGYWPMNDGTTTLADDFSGQDSVGVLSTGASTLPAWTSGKLGRALSFDGSSSYVDVTPGSALNNAFASAGSVSVWVNATDINSRWQGIVTKGRDTATWWGIWLAGSDNKWHFGAPSGLELAGSSATSGWHHIVITMNGTARKIYVDGIQAGSDNNGSNVSNSSNLWIGGSKAQATEYFSGKIDDVRVYSRALSAAEVASLYTTGAVLHKLPNNLGLIGYWPMNEGTSTQATDFSGQGRTGVLSTSGSTLPSWTSGRLGRALSFDGSTNYVQIGGLMGSPSKITLSAWVNLTSPDTGGAEVISLGDIVAIELDSNICGGNIDGFYHYATNWRNACTSSTLAGKGWHYVAFVVDPANSRQEVYIDGVSSASNTFSDAIDYSGNGANTIIGKHANGLTTKDFNGKMDDIRVYNRALSTAEVQNLYSQNSAVRIAASSKDLTNGSTLGSGLVGLWTFDGGDLNWTSATAGVVYDGSGNGRTGTLTNMNQATSTTVGVLGQAISLSSSTYVDLPTYTFSSSATYSATAWVYRTINSEPYWASIFWNASASNEAGLRIIHASNPCFTISDNTLGINVPGSPGSSVYCWDTKLIVPINTWAFVAVSASTTGEVVYMGTSTSLMSAINTNANTPVTDTLNASIGRDPNAFGRFFTGKIDDVRFYNRALSTAEIQQLYFLGRAKVKP